MRSFAFIVATLLVATGGFAQDTITQVNGNQKNQVSMSTSPTDGEPSYYTFENQEFKFIPNELGFHIIRIDNGNEVDYGTLMLTTDDGYYAMTSNLNDHVSYGRFDEAGNFKGKGYDENTGAFEENFIRSTKKEN